VTEGRAGPGVEKASKDDAAWFEAHPNRQLRLRDRIPGEYEPAASLDDLVPPPGTTPRTLVLQLQPGVRGRYPVAIFPHVKNDEMTDAQLFAFFKEVIPFEAQDIASKFRKVKLSGKPKPTSEW
jgi:hypothetical protein